MLYVAERVPCPVAVLCDNAWVVTTAQQINDGQIVTKKIFALRRGCVTPCLADSNYGVLTAAVEEVGAGARRSGACTDEPLVRAAAASGPTGVTGTVADWMRAMGWDGHRVSPAEAREDGCRHWR